jgi:DNA-binding transcriptional MocR family regulator
VLVDPDLLPRAELEDCARRVIDRGLAALPDPQGAPELREAIASRLSRRGIEATADEVIVTTGSQQAIDLVARALEVRRVATESPVYGHARMLFEAHSLEVTALPLDPFTGADMAAWEERVLRARPGLLYLQSRFQNPTGHSYPRADLERLLEMAAKAGAGVLDDDWAADMLPDDGTHLTLRALGGANVLYAGSFTKKLFPALRVGFLLSPRALVGSLVGQKRLSSLAGVHLSESIVAEYMRSGGYDAHLVRLQRELSARYAACLEVLGRTMPEGVRWTEPAGGPTLFLSLPQHVELAPLRARLAARGVIVEDPAPAEHGDGPRLHGFRVSYAFCKPEQIERALRIVGEELRG